MNPYSHHRSFHNIHDSYAIKSSVTILVDEICVEHSVRKYNNYILSCLECFLSELMILNIEENVSVPFVFKVHLLIDIYL